MNYDNHEVKDDVMGTDSGGGGARSFTDGNTTPVMGVKRKGTLFSLNSKAEESESRIEVGLAFIKSSLKTAMNEAKSGGEKPVSGHLMKLLEDIYDVVAPMLTRKGKLRSPLLPQPRNGETYWRLALRVGAMTSWRWLTSELIRC